MINENVVEFFSDEVSHVSTEDGYTSSLLTKFNPFLMDLMEKYTVFSLQILPATRIFVFTFEDTNTKQTGRVFPTSLFRNNPDFYRFLMGSKFSGGRQLLDDWMDTTLQTYIRMNEDHTNVMIKLVKLVRGELTSDEINRFYFENRDKLAMTAVFNEIATQPLIVKKKDENDEE